MSGLTLIQQVSVWIIPVLFAITVHEVAHGWVAKKLGDPTAKQLGRLTLNPIVHVDLVGTIIVPIACLLLTSVVFGWAKPVPITWRNLKKPRRDSALVALGGPVANFLMVLGWAAILKLSSLFPLSRVSHFFFYMGAAGITINSVLMVLNLLPIPPLDGSRVVASLLPRRLAFYYERIEPYGFFILIALLLTGILPMLLQFPLALMQYVVMSVFQL